MYRIISVMIGVGLVQSLSPMVAGASKSSPQNTGPCWVVDSQQEWTDARQSAGDIQLKNGFAEPIGVNGKFESIVKSYGKKKKPSSIVFRQSPVWDNWKQIDDITPEGIGNAFVILPVAPGDYYLFATINHPVVYAKGMTPDERRAYKKKYFKDNPIPAEEKGYQVWHSTDLKTWTHHGQVCKSHWMTTAEYIDGKFYLYYDQPNDQEPHLIIDDDLKDGVYGKEMGMVFNDPSDGSDIAIFRDEDGTVHLIYEDWKAVPPAERGFDSPLAGHTSSPDGIHGFTPHKHAFAIDHRTQPTGKFAKDRRGTEYEIHEPEQNVYGDYTMIKVGGRYYLFGDYEPAGEGKMRICRFTTDDIYKEFTFAGEIGEGFHPDPSIGFAEGQFYIVMQQATDFVSPGPWVDGVEARAGVDVNGDGSIDEWTDWQQVRETYTQKPGFARIVDVEPATLDLSTLPAGFGFKFEFKTTPLEANQVQPIMDCVELNFQ